MTPSLKTKAVWPIRTNVINEMNQSEVEAKICVEKASVILATIGFGFAQ